MMTRGVLIRGRELYIICTGLFLFLHPTRAELTKDKASFVTGCQLLPTDVACSLMHNMRLMAVLCPLGSNILIPHCNEKKRIPIKKKCFPNINPAHILGNICENSETPSIQMSQSS